MARLVVRRGDLVLRLNPVERILDLRLQSPRAALTHVASVDVTRRPGSLLEQVDQGFAGNTAPLGFLVTAQSRNSKYQGRRAAAFVYLRQPSIAVTFHESCPWSLWLVSSPRASKEVVKLRSAAGL